MVSPVSSTAHLLGHLQARQPFVHCGGKQQLSLEQEAVPTKAEGPRGDQRKNLSRERTAQTLRQRQWPPITMKQDKQTLEQTIRLQGQRPGRARFNITSGCESHTMCTVYKAYICDKAIQHTSQSCFRMSDWLRQIVGGHLSF